MLFEIHANTETIAHKQGAIMAAIDDLKAAGARIATSSSAALAAAVKTITDSQASNGGGVSAGDAEAVVSQLNATSDALDKAAADFAAEDPTEPVVAPAS